MGERMFGIETEYGFSSFDAAGKPLNRMKALGQLMEVACERLPHLPGLHSSGIFLTNGARFYVDCGHHPEVATPECTNPWDAVRYVLAGERMLEELGESFKESSAKKARAFFIKCNVDYGGGSSTWGCHESYLHATDPVALAPEIIPHLVSRIIFCGAGGFDNRLQGFQFLISPRASHLEHVVSPQSTHSRGIFHTKDESLSKSGYHRLHILCGESLCSHTAAWLKVATTALVVTLIEGGVHPGRGVQLSAPVSALRAFAGDPSLKATAAAGDRSLSAIAIQRHYLSAAEAHREAAFMPPWAGEACRQWRSALDALEEGPERPSRTFDWAIKLALFKSHSLRRGFPWESIPLWSKVMGKLRSALKKAELPPGPIPLELLRSAHSPVPKEMKELGGFLEANRLDWERLASFLELEQELYEIDTRFGQLGPDSIFHQLDRAGALAHAFPGVDNIEHAQAHPPASGRAVPRGEWVQLLSGRTGNHCDWDGVWHGEERRMLDLSDPFQTQPSWRAHQGSPDADLDRIFLSARYATMMRRLRR